MFNVPESATYDPHAPWNLDGDFSRCEKCFEQVPINRLWQDKHGKYFCPDCIPYCDFRYSPDAAPCRNRDLVDGYDHCARCMVIDLGDYLLERLKLDDPADDAEFFAGLRAEIAEMERLRDGGAR